MVKICISLVGISSTTVQTILWSFPHDIHYVITPCNRSDKHPLCISVPLLIVIILKIVLRKTVNDQFLNFSTPDIVILLNIIFHIDLNKTFDKVICCYGEFEYFLNFNKTVLFTTYLRNLQNLQSFYRWNTNLIRIKPHKSFSTLLTTNMKINFLRVLDFKWKKIVQSSTSVKTDYTKQVSFISERVFQKLSNH